MARSVPPEAARRSLRGDVQLVDVREDKEWDELCVEGAIRAPFSRLEELPERLAADRPVLLLSWSGTRAGKAARCLETRGFRDVAVVAGGLRAWRACELPVIEGSLLGISFERKIHLCGGLLLLAGIALALVVHPGFRVLASLVGVALFLLGARGFVDRGRPKKAEA